ncbi:hypothetical protein [Halegenticoccus tardaugens]|uniref:hypothetical protein n=1 Tax=Halegenticoccus tardaugens TaxID=2071624 RepID=UPI00100BDF67|nr:hypothetical protein [Halegenticoccus tardaugens]
MDDLVAAVRESLSAETRAAFDRRVERQSALAKADCRSARLDNRDFAVGLELEAYAVDGDGRLGAVPPSVFEAADCEKELGVHNVELHTEPDVLDVDGLNRQSAQLRERLRSTRDRLADAGLRLVLDGMWTVPPAEGTAVYLGDVEERHGVVVAANMRSDPRYRALDNDALRRGDGEVPISVPGVDRAFPSILVESLTTSMQPHLQVPDSAAFPRYFNAAIRTLGPVLALAANSPFLPADLYEGADPATVVDATPHELRVPVFEQSVNVGDLRKVRVPRDVDGVEDVVDRLVADETVAPFLTDPDEAGEYPTAYPELDHKRGTYWRWVRAVIGGQTPAPAAGPERNDEASVRIEYRPLPTQPTLRDAVGLQALVVGLLRGVVATDHPLETLDWTDAEASFYAAVDDGPNADLAWVTADGERTDDPAVVYDEAFALARRGLDAFGVDGDAASALLAPIEARREARTSPSAWKKARVREAVAAGASLPEAIVSMQEAYVRRAEGTASFAEWL